LEVLENLKQMKLGPDAFKLAAALVVLAAAILPFVPSSHAFQAQAAQAPSPAPPRVDYSKYEAPPELLNPNLPKWAYTPSPAPLPPGAPRPVRKPDDGAALHVPGSDKGFTRRQIGSAYDQVDWFPEDHAPAPNVVMHGMKPAFQACALCHLPTGYGRPENMSINGLPASYILDQFEDFKNDRRHNTVPGMPGTMMIVVAKNVTPEDAKEAAEYFSKIKPVKWIRVVETATVPKTVPGNHMWVEDPKGGTEPLGNRIIELSENTELTEMRDTHSGFIAYVPIGSVRKGRLLVRTGAAGKTTTCATCHGPDLKGMGSIPPIAGRSPSQLARQMYDFRSGARNGTNSVLMKGVVAKLTDTDIVNIMAYLATLPQK
jgi:cytochrome c553